MSALSLFLHTLSLANFRKHPTLDHPHRLVGNGRKPAAKRAKPAAARNRIDVGGPEIRFFERGESGFSQWVREEKKMRGLVKKENIDALFVIFRGN